MPAPQPPAARAAAVQRRDTGCHHEAASLRCWHAHRPAGPARLTPNNGNGWKAARNWCWARRHRLSAVRHHQWRPRLPGPDRRLRKPDRQGPAVAGPGAALSSRQAAVEALRHGDIDLLGSANGYEAASDGLALSHPYAIDQPVLVTREDENRALDTDLTGMRLGMLYHYLPRQEVLSAYPKAELLAFGPSSQALNAVAFGQADVFIGDTISTHYQLNRGHLPRLRMANFGKHEAIGFGFACASKTPCCWTW
jgi:hypothetical protein